ncbi:MAG: pectate lyase family protein [Chitinophagaceae bacterium]
MINRLSTVSVLIFLFVVAGTQAQPLAFPGAEGFGRFTSGGRGGRVLYVTNLNDDGPGSLRAALKEKGARTILFSVSGNIELQSRLPINNGDVTIAGQSAPGDGICITGYPVSVSADNVIIRYLRIRLGDANKVEADAIGGTGHRNIIIDHCSISWSTDECASFYRNRDFTLQWCLISESLNASAHVKGEHGYGGIWGGEGASFHHNLLAHHKSRMPRFSGSSSTQNPEDELVDYRYNVVYNWTINNSYGGEKGKYNVVNNYYKAGPATRKTVVERILNPSSPYGLFYVKGNVLENSPKVTADNWKGVHGKNVDSARAEKPFPAPEINGVDAKKAYELVLKFAGASYKRDALDERIVQEVRSGTASRGKEKNGIINTVEESGGLPVLKSAIAPKDTEGDGIPDVWEKEHKLDPLKNDAQLKTLHKDYTNLEIYLNSLLQLPAGKA